MTPYARLRLTLVLSLFTGILAIFWGGNAVVRTLVANSQAGLLPSGLAESWAEAVRSGQWLLTGALVLGLAALWLVLGRPFRQAARRRLEEGRGLRELAAHAEVAHDRTLIALSRAIDLRDHETDRHSVRVTAYSLALASALGLTGPEVLELSWGALLHDVGKLGIPDAILLKQGPLTRAEWETMRCHPELGHALLADIAYLSGSLAVVLQHHERFDGRGYPHALSGESISPLARLFSVADSFDAMTSDRPYRTRMTYMEARAEILRGRGTQFDPAAVDAFLTIPAETWLRLAREAAGIQDGDGLRQLLGRGVASAQAVAAGAALRRH